MIFDKDIRVFAIDCRFAFVLLTALLLVLSSPLKAQSQYQLVPEDQKLAVTGTSTLHDWEMLTSQATGEGTFYIEGGQLARATGLEISFQAESLKSGKRGMDKKAYKALKTSDHTTVTFLLTEYRPQPGAEQVARGMLTVAGQSREIAFKVKEEVIAGKVQVSGSTTFKLTDFEIEPPRALAGTIRTGDDVTIQFNLIFKLK